MLDYLQTEIRRLLKVNKNYGASFCAIDKSKNNSKDIYERIITMYPLILNYGEIRPNDFVKNLKTKFAHLNPQIELKEDIHETLSRGNLTKYLITITIDNSGDLMSKINKEFNIKSLDEKIDKLKKEIVKLEAKKAELESQ